jgi:tRNA(Ile2) C34 agmatinyltransferase TiaS
MTCCPASSTLMAHLDSLGKTAPGPIEKIYEADPLVCPKCNGRMRITGSQRRKVLLQHGLA